MKSSADALTGVRLLWLPKFTTVAISELYRYICRPTWGASGNFLRRFALHI